MAGTVGGLSHLILAGLETVKSHLVAFYMGGNQSQIGNGFGKLSKVGVKIIEENNQTFSYIIIAIYTRCLYDANLGRRKQGAC